MEYNYNGNMLFEDRLDDVSSEITNAYPEVSQEKALFVASLEDPITTYPNINIMTKRLYNLMLVNYDNKLLQSKIFYDMIKIYKNSSSLSNENINLFLSLANFFNNNGEFPSYI